MNLIDVIIEAKNVKPDKRFMIYEKNKENF